MSEGEVKKIERGLEDLGSLVRDGFSELDKRVRSLEADVAHIRGSLEGQREARHAGRESLGLWIAGAALALTVVSGMIGYAVGAG